MRTLLEDLQQRLGCLYLSDLHTAPFHRRALLMALACSPEDYPPEQWQEAASYLLGQVPSSASVQELRALLEQAAAEPKSPRPSKTV